MFAQNTSYSVLWQKRTGFAKVSLATMAPIIPMFTENIREATLCITNRTTVAQSEIFL